MSLIIGPHFDGETYEPNKDHIRLTGQLLRVYQAMHDQEWHTLSQLSMRAEGSEASVSARLRDLRKEKFGDFVVQRKRSEKSRGLWYYRLVLPKHEPEQQSLL